MPIYTAPVDDYRFLLHDYLHVQERDDLPGFSGLTPDFTAEILGAAARFHEGVLHPINAPGDREGARFEGGRVTTPTGYRRAWTLYKDSGWHRMTLPEAIGGSGLPRMFGIAISEMIAASSHSFMMYGGFCAPAAYMLSEVGDPWMRQHVVPRLVAGDWTATMCLTESHCGTDLRQLRTKAVPNADGSWRITGSKIFISGGEHDLTDNIVHIVLAKVPDAEGRLPSGLSSVNVFLVSKLDLDPITGQLGGANGVSATSIENKMGIEGNATCVMHFEGARGWRLSGTEGGRTSSNMAAMFLMMKHARLETAVSGISYAEIAYQNAAAYARERLSGRASQGARNPQGAADPIIVHADIRRMLLGSRAFAEGARGTAVRVALLQEVAAHSHDAALRQDAADLVELMTPVMKAYFTDKGFEAANACLQVLGGQGYVHDYGLEQMVRNARIGQIYEGANGIQAFDLVARKLTVNDGRAEQVFMAVVQKTIERLAVIPRLQTVRAALEHGLRQLQVALQHLRAQAMRDRDALGAAAYDVLTMFGILSVGWIWGEIAAVVSGPSSIGRDAAASRQKLTLAQLWMEREMPSLAALLARVRNGSSSLMSLSDSEV